MRIYKFIPLTLMLCLSGIGCYGQAVTDIRSLLREMIDYDALSKWPQYSYTEKEASSYDRRSVAPGKPGWFANADASQYIRTETTEGRTELVMMDADGPGAIVRFWLTTFKRNGTLRIYFDKQPQPAITIPAYDLMLSGLAAGPALLSPHSSYELKEKGGSTMYLPLPYARHCKITFEDKDNDNQPRYYQVNYRAYAKDCKVKTFTLAQLEAAKPLVDSVNERLLHPDIMPAGKNSAVNKLVGKGDVATLNLPSGQRAVRLIAISTDTDTIPDGLMISMRFDDKQTVYCPLADFAGSGKGGRPVQSWYRTVKSGGKIFIRWVMPYRRSASISVKNRSDEQIPVQLSVITASRKWNNNSLYFHADWKNGLNIPVRKEEKDNPKEWNFVTIKGRGVFLGDTFAVDNLMHTWYGEGDQKYWVDGGKFPSEYGTGTEDYYNTSWAPVVLYQTPFANAPRADNGDSYGANTFTRTRNLDRVPFTRSFRYDLEMLGWQNGAINASCVTYWYGDISAGSINNH
ncbi:MAG: glycoside hydrolase family 172 protein [Mucilaginibacter sp.]